MNEKSVNIEDRTTEEMLTLINDYFTSRSILVDEKPGHTRGALRQRDYISEVSIL